ncbi:uncharacterized protein BKCO1_19000146 [Diplodia corticola]|uniref:Uncharacterized protein n=1 Tax=Diplodia corticola TaxID=236234 RepID=A0A1J9S583_9PEZI|nr:uncharacterized protein BKCO1_19000146 [Diplodia corticola]OJD35108.1 hypothetical protein BKCO1_19000146 [Diplodia corticola]
MTRRILFFVSEPTITYDGRKRTYKYGHPRNLHHPPDDIQNARLVCKAFADLGAEFLLRNLVVSADLKQLAHVKEIAEHKRLCKAVRSLYYDCRTFPDTWPEEPGSDADDDLEDVEEHPPPEPRPLYHEQEDIFKHSLDTECLRAALGTLTAVTRVRCKPRERFPHHPLERSRHDPGDVSSAGRRNNNDDDDNGDRPSNDRDARPLYHLAAAMTSAPAHNIRTLSLSFHLTLLADARLAPQRFASLLAALAPVTDLTLAVRTDDAGLGTPQDLAKYAAAYGPHPTAISLFKAILFDPSASTTTTASSAPLAALFDATSRTLHRLKLTLSPIGRRRRDDNSSTSWRYALPLSAFLGSAAATTTTSPPPIDPPHPIRWPTLHYLSLGCVDATAADLTGFLLPRRHALAYTEFDRVWLRRGQWCVVGAVALRAAGRAWRWSKMNRLGQVEAVEAVVVLPGEVAGAVREAEEGEEGEEGEGQRGKGKGGEVRVAWDECYFAAGEDCSTLSAGEGPDEARGPGYGWPV